MMSYSHEIYEVVYICELEISYYNNEWHETRVQDTMFVSFPFMLHHHSQFIIETYSLIDFRTRC
jgi:hypothetical protein